MTTKSNQKGKEKKGQYKLVGLDELAQRVTKASLEVDEAKLALNMECGYGTPAASSEFDDKHIAKARRNLEKAQANLAEAMAKYEAADPVAQERKKRDEATSSRQDIKAAEEKRKRLEVAANKIADQKRWATAMRAMLFELHDDAASNYQEFLGGVLTADEALAALDKLCGQLKEYELERKAGKQAGQELKAEFEKTFALLASHMALIRSGGVLLENVESWEELIPDGPDDPIVIPNRQVQTELLQGISVQFPFADAKPDFEQTASHCQLNSSRIVGSTLMMMKAAKKARQIAPHCSGKCPPVVFDVGAGAFGAKRLQILKTDPRNVGIAIHATLPRVDAADDDRLKECEKTPGFLRWNYIPETKTPQLNCLNYCRHKASECDCLRYYHPDGREVLAIHSAYYFTHKDWDQLFKYAQTVETLVHIPKIGDTIPLSKPEYEWVDVEQDKDAGALTRFAAKLKRLATGETTVAMKPMTTGGTRYVHSDISQIIKRGGFHVTDTSLWLQPTLNSSQECLKMAAAGIAAATTCAAIGSIGASAPVVVATVLTTAVKSALSMLIWARIQSLRTRSTQPMPWTKYTVTARISSSYNAAGTEELAHVVRFTKVGAQELQAACVDSAEVDQENVHRVTGAVLMAKDKAQGLRQMAASMLRDNVSIKKVRDTLTQAERLTRYVIPNGRSAPSGAPWSAWVVALSLSVLATKCYHPLTQCVASMTPIAQIAAPVCILLTCFAHIPLLLIIVLSL